VFRGERTIGGMPGAWGPIVILEYLSLLGESLRRWQAGERLTFTAIPMGLKSPLRLGRRKQ
jgi:hypothetical protein